MSQFLETLVQGIMLGGVYSLLALALVLVFKSTKVVSLAHGGIMMIMAYILIVFLDSIGLPLWLSLMLVLAIGALAGLFMERFLMRPLVGQVLFPQFIVTLLVMMLLGAVVDIVWWGEPKALTIISKELISFGGISISQSYLWSFVIALLIFILLVSLFHYTKVGLAMRSVAEDTRVSQSMGISVKRISALSWAFSCVIAVIAGILLASISVVEPALANIGLAKSFPVLILGGMQSIPGALLGGIIIGVTELLVAVYGGSELREVVPFTLLLLILIIRPHGLFGERVVERI